MCVWTKDSSCTVYMNAAYQTLAHMCMLKAYTHIEYRHYSYNPQFILLKIFVLFQKFRLFYHQLSISRFHWKIGSIDIGSGRETRTHPTRSIYIHYKIRSNQKRKPSANCVSTIQFDINKIRLLIACWILCVFVFDFISKMFLIELLKKSFNAFIYL